MPEAPLAVARDLLAHSMLAIDAEKGRVTAGVWGTLLAVQELLDEAQTDEQAPCPTCGRPTVERGGWIYCATASCPVAGRVASSCEKYPHDGCGAPLDDGLPLRGWVSTDADVLNAALNAVEALHSEGRVTGQEAHCDGCSAPERGYLVPWPCPTRTAIMDALMTDEGRGTTPEDAGRMDEIDRDLFVLAATGLSWEDVKILGELEEEKRQMWCRDRGFCCVAGATAAPDPCPWHPVVTP